MSGIAPGRYELSAAAPGFEAQVVPDFVVRNERGGAASITLRIASTRTSIEVKEPLLGSASATSVEPGFSSRAQASNTAELLATTPGVSLRENGTLGSIPMLHGLGDERTRLVVDSMTVTSACPNHMNPPSSYMSPAHAAKMTVMPGITPVSMGGDSLGGTIAIESTEPTFARTGERVSATVNSSGFYRSNGKNYGGSANITPTYNWTISAGRIISGQGTPTITVDTAGMAGQTIRADLDIGGYGMRCPASCVVSIPVSNKPRKFDEYYDIARNDEKARLDNYVIQLQSEPGSQGYIIVYPSRRARPSEAQARATRISDYLVNSRGIDANRFNITMGAAREDWLFELWIVPAGATPPAPQR